MKIRFYHWWIYSLYYKFWTPIYRDKPHMLKAQVDWAEGYLDDLKENK